MKRCPACSHEVPESNRFCGACGAALPAPPGEPTGPYQPAGSAAPQAGPGPPPSPDPSGPSQRFPPGQLLAGRYRLVSRLGKGGLGEVYRADDLKLGEAVALTFLPEHLTTDPERLLRLRKEVAAARKVAHPNVCRVYDIAETLPGDSRPPLAFLAMEFIDGEDLAALLRRIGRLPEDKAVEVARHLCSGLAAVHEQGLLHRDLKPANVMLDGRGKVRLTDFGLAAAAEAITASDVRSGTPAYQAPEQLAGHEVTVQSDLFALGLVLYELFTGKKAYPAKNRGELERLHEQGTPSKPSSHVSSLDPAVERVILRCLAKRPADRPRSAYEVLAGLPGGDPLAAALAAGETPSPRMVADAGGEGSLPPWLACLLLTVFLFGIVFVAVSNDKVALFRQVPLTTSPDVLAAKARELIGRFGYPTDAADTSYRLAYDNEFYFHFAPADPVWGKPVDLSTGQPAALYFWYRQSPHFLVPSELELGLYPGRVTPADPPPLEPGMATIFLDLKGRLIEFHYVPHRVPRTDAKVLPATGASTVGLLGSSWGQGSFLAAAAVIPGRADAKEPEPDWDKLFDAAGLDRVKFQETAPHWLPPVYADRRKAWAGSFPDRPELPICVEAAAYQGKPVYFQIDAGPWSTPHRAHSVFPREPDRQAELIWGLGVNFTLTPFVLAGGLVLAARNLRLGRADRTAAFRLAVALGVGDFICIVSASTHVPSSGLETNLLMRGASFALCWAGMAWVFYLAFEPLVRRRWPWWTISWNRLVAGRFRDPRLGRDVLIGGALGVGLSLVLAASLLTWLALDRRPPPQTFFGVWAHPQSFTHLTFSILTQLTDSVRTSLQWFTEFFLLFLLLRKAWLAVPVYFFLELVPQLRVQGNLDGAAFALTAVTVLLFAGMQVFVALRYGVLAFVVGMVVYWTLLGSPITYDLRTWYWGSTVAHVLALLVLAGYGFVVSLGGRALFTKGFFGDD